MSIRGIKTLSQKSDNDSEIEEKGPSSPSISRPSLNREDVSDSEEETKSSSIRSQAHSLSISNRSTTHGSGSQRSPSPISLRSREILEEKYNSDSEPSSEDSDSSDEDYLETKHSGKPRDEMLPVDIMERISTFMTNKDKTNTFGTNKTMSDMKHVATKDLSDTPLTMRNLVKHAKELSKYRITGLSIIVVAYPRFKDEKHPSFKYVSNILSGVTNLKLKLVVVRDPLAIKYAGLILERTPNLTSLKYSGGFDNNIVTSITNLSGLNSLSVKGVGSVGILETLDNIPNLITLKVKYIAKVNLLGLDKLKHLKLNEVVTVLVQVCSNLETFICNKQTISGFSNLRSMPNLIELNLTKTRLDTPLKGVKNHPSLQKIILKEVTNVPVLNFGSCPHLQELEVETNTDMALESLRQCPKLKRLNLNGNITINSFVESLKHIEIYNNNTDLDINMFLICSKLKSLYSEIMSDYPDLMCLSNCTNLKTLWLQSENCESLKGLNLLTKLENLYLTGLGLMEDISPIAGCVSLRRLSTQVMGKDLRYLANCPNLISLHIDQGFNGLSGLETCTNLVELTLNQCNVKDLSKLNGCTRLKFLSLSYMEKLTSLSGLEDCKDLVGIHIDNCLKLINIDALQQCSSLLIFETKKTPKIDIISLRKCLSLIRVKIDGKDKDLLFLQSMPQLTTINNSQTLF